MEENTSQIMSDGAATVTAVGTTVKMFPQLKVLRSDFFLKVSETFATKGVTFCLGLVVSIFVARVLGPSGRGTYATALVLTALGVQFGNFGLHAANTFFVARDRLLLGVLVTNALVVSAGIGFVLAFTLGIIAKILPAALPVHGPILALVLIGVPLGTAYLLLQNLLLGCYRIRDFNRIEILNRCLNLAILFAAALVVVISPSIALSVNLMAVGVSVTCCLIALSSGFKLVTPSWQLFRRTFSYGCRPYLTAIFGFAVFKADLILVARMLGAREAGFYSVAVNLSDMIYVLPTAVGSILFPKLAQMTNRDEKLKQTTKVAVVVGVLMLILCVIAALASARLVPFLFGVPFGGSVLPFNWLLPGIVLMSLTSIFSAYIASERIPWSVVWVYGVMGAADIGINLLYLRKIGITGAAQLSSACYMGCFIGILLIARGISHEAN